MPRMSPPKPIARPKRAVSWFGLAVGWSGRGVMFVLLTGLALAEEAEPTIGFPYQARVLAAYATVFCGPTDDAYVTARLQRGEWVEVHRLDPGGWLAIRPPAGSHGWVPTRFVRPMLNSAAVEVRSPSTVAWIGSIDPQSADLKWQIHLEVGEQLLVLGHETRRTFPEGPIEPHYRIAPPSGEFRWVRVEDIQAVATLATQPAPATLRLVEHSTQNTEEPQTATAALLMEAEPLDTAASDAESPPQNSTSETGENRVKSDRALQEGARPRERTPVPTVAVTGVEPPGVKPQASMSARESTQVRQPERLPRTMTAPSPQFQTARLVPLEQLEFDSDVERISQQDAERDFHQKLSDLEIQLSLALTKPPLQWPMARLRRQVERLMEEANTTLDRARVQLFLETIAESEQLQARIATSAGTEPAGTEPAVAEEAEHQATTSADPGDSDGLREDPARSLTVNDASGNIANPSPLAAVRSRAATLGSQAAASVSQLVATANGGTAPPTSPSLNPRFDGVGWLSQVWSQGKSSPPYALVDAQGQVLQWVSPAPGLNLHRYLRKEIGIFGQRTQDSRLSKPHLTAERVVDLARHRQ
jgi:hypothetical protein